MQRKWYRPEELDYRILDCRKEELVIRKIREQLEKERQALSKRMDHLTDRISLYQEQVESLERNKKCGKPDGWFSADVMHAQRFQGPQGFLTTVSHIISISKLSHLEKLIFVRKGHTDQELIRIDDLFKKEHWHRIHMTMVEIKKDSIERVYTPIEHSWLLRSREPYIPKGLGS